MATPVVIDVDGNFNEEFQKDLKLDDREDSPLAVVSIIGAQSSGKSTLLNYMFHTKFEEMDAKSGIPRQRTTKGIRVAKYSLNSGCILVVDTEGSDGKEREGDTFARQTTLFALAISRVVIINMMCTDVGRESGGGWPILRAACEVMLQSFTTAHEVTFLFVLRDKTNSPKEVLQRQIKDEMEKILSRMTGPQAQVNARLSHLFKIHVETTSYYLVESERPNFIAEVHKLRNWITSHITSNVSTSELITPSGFTRYAQEIWDKIKEEKELNLPASRIMVAQVHCKRIAREQCDRFREDVSWIQIKENMGSGSIMEGFGKEVSDLIRTHRSQYEENAKNHDETTRDEYGEELTAKLLEIIRPTYDRLANLMMEKTLEDFKKTALDELTNEGTLRAINIQDFINAFDDQLKDAKIEQAKWTSTQVETLETAMKLFIEGTKITNTKIDELKMERKTIWRKIQEAFLKALHDAREAFIKALRAMRKPFLKAALHEGRKYFRSKLESYLKEIGVPTDIATLVLNLFAFSY